MLPSARPKETTSAAREGASKAKLDAIRKYSCAGAQNMALPIAVYHSPA